MAGAVGSSGHHHAYPGGLLVHTAEVLSLALSMAEKLGKHSVYDVLTSAAIYHDLCKVREYKLHEDGTIEKLPYRKLVRHIAGSVAEFTYDLYSLTLDRTWPPVQEETEIAIMHAMLAHHGRPEWGACVEPQTVEAHILHYADMLSAGFGPDKEARPE